MSQERYFGNWVCVLNDSLMFALVRLPTVTSYNIKY